MTRSIAGSVVLNRNTMKVIGSPELAARKVLPGTPATPPDEGIKDRSQRDV